MNPHFISMTVLKVAHPFPCGLLVELHSRGKHVGVFFEPRFVESLQKSWEDD